MTTITSTIMLYEKQAKTLLNQKNTVFTSNQ